MQPARARIDTVPDWFPDWQGMAAAIVASGPSVRKASVGLLQGRLPVIAIKKSVELCPWADVVYGCDPAWWKSVRGLPDFKGLKLSWATGICDEYRDIHRVFIDDNRCDRMIFNELGHVGAGGNSGFQAINLAVQFGAKRILLVGFDMQDNHGEHWYGRNHWPMANNPNNENFRRWRAALETAAVDLQRMGVEVVNASPNSGLKCFRKASVEQTLADWGL